MLTEVLVNFIENIQTVHGIFALGKHLFFLFGKLNTAFPKRGCIVMSGMIITRNTNGLLQKLWVDLRCSSSAFGELKHSREGKRKLRSLLHNFDRDYSHRRTPRR